MGVEEKDGENGYGTVQSSQKTVGKWDCHPQGRRSRGQVGLSAYFNFFVVTGDRPRSSRSPSWVKAAFLDKVCDHCPVMVQLPGRS